MFRKQKGLSQRGLFAISGIDNGTICRMENGELNVTLKSVAVLARALDIPEWRLLLKVEEEIKESTNSQV
jgi:transcriptional regulator with XRE-family HTH domain